MARRRWRQWGGRGALALILATSALACDDDETTADPADMAGGAGGQGGAGGAGAAGGEGGGAPYDLELPGMDGPATAWLDAHGFLHAKCSTNADCFRVEGYFHAAHRFSQMDIRRRVVRGQLSAIVGNILLDVDTRNRTWYADPTSGQELAEQMWAGASPEARAAVEAYSQGVNAWLARMRAGEVQLTDEYTFDLIDKTAIRDWEPLDSAAAILALLDSLTNSTGDELFGGARHSSLPAGMAEDLFGLRPGSPATVLPQARKRGDFALDLELLQRRQARLAPFASLLEAAAERADRRAADVTGRGSNNWVVSPSQSRTGNALLANDPHLGLSNPAVWYVVHLDSQSAGTGDLDVAGVSFAGLPGIIIGHNRHLAWGVTTTFFDFSDVYLETLSPDGQGVMYQGMEVPFLSVDFPLEVSQGDAATVTGLYVPHHGPVLAIDREAGTAITGKWSGHAADTDLNFLVRMPKATTVAEAREALTSLTTTGQNFVVADRAGSIGWFPYSRVPSRPWMSPELAPWLPLPGSGVAEWDGFIDYADLPQAVDPPAGWLATANNDMTGALWDGDPTNDGQAALQGYVAFGKRQERILALLETLGGEAGHDRDGMETMLADVHSALGAEVVPAALAALGEADLTERASTLRGILAGWDFECPTGFDGVDPATASPSTDPRVLASAIGCSAFHVVWFTLRELTFLDELAAEGYQGNAYPAPMLHQLVRPEVLSVDYWDDVSTPDVQETAADILARALEQSAERLGTWIGPNPNDWLWGRLHQLTLRADLFSDAGLSQFDHGPFLNDGGLYTVDVANPSFNRQLGRLDHRSGASMRFACEVKGDTGPDCTLQIPGGQQHYRDSPHYDDLFQRWLINESVPLTTDWATIEAGATGLRVGPRP